MNTLYLVEREDECGSFEEPQIFTIEGLMRLGQEFDEEIEENNVVDALTSTFGYTITEINKMLDFLNVFEILKENYMNY